MKAWRGSICLSGVLACGLAAGCSSLGDDDRAAVAVTAAPAEVGSITAVIQAAGVVTAAAGGEQIVTAPEPARIVELPKGEQEPVTRGEMLVRFEIDALQSAAESQGADLSRAEAEVARVRAEHARLSDLFARGLVPRMSVDEAESQITAAEGSLRAARAAASTREAGAAPRTMVRALFDGVVHRRFREIGDLVLPATPILSVIDPQQLEVTASMPFAEAIRINVGNAARIVTAPEVTAVAGPVTLRVVSRPEGIDDSPAPVLVRLAFDAPPAIAVDAPVQLAINAEVREGVILVPLAAIALDPDEGAVFVVRDGRVERRAVSIGITDATNAEITAGLEPGEVVVVESRDALFDGAKVVTVDAPQ